MSYSLRAPDHATATTVIFRAFFCRRAAPAHAFSIYSTRLVISANGGHARPAGINRRVGSLIVVVINMETDMFKYALPRLLVLSAMLGLAACSNVATPAQMAAANYEYSYQAGN